MDLHNIDPLLDKLKEKLDLHYSSNDTVKQGIELFFEGSTSYGRKTAQRLLDYTFNDLDIMNNLNLLDDSYALAPLSMNLRIVLNGLHYLTVENCSRYTQYISGAIYELAEYLKKKLEMDAKNESKKAGHV